MIFGLKVFWEVFGLSFCLALLMLVGTACFQVLRKSGKQGRVLLRKEPPPWGETETRPGPKATADDVRQYPEPKNDE